MKTLNCSELLEKGYTPTPSEAYAVLGNWALFLAAVESLMVVTTVAVFVHECHYLSACWPRRTLLYSSLALAVFPVTSVCALVATVFPRVHDATSSIIMLYLPFSLVMYFELISCYAGGSEQLVQRLINEQMPLRGPPICCVLWCCPTPSFSKQRYAVLRVVVYQLFFIPLILITIIFVCTLTGIHEGDKMEATNASPYLMLLQAGSFLLGTYGFVIFVKLASRPLPPQLLLRRKFTVLHLHFTLTRLQLVAFKAAGLTGHLPCVPPLASMVTGVYLSSAMLMGQGFMVSTVSRYFFLHPPPTSTLPLCPPAPTSAHVNSHQRSSTVSLPRPQANAHQASTRQASSRYLAAFTY
ncbi:organic solute transporter subunit alpha [Dermacentor andersoni]|uniref:organic solute transporter subunit alpha n=1 Tax=Dermacentor andersoni TaxID=34620 RepID=UPI0021550992|nr:organic solute transporter subunit alpha-like [Dermacentor andersoni]XP_050029379.1 organic solute transporter subunit alpha-like [Dermacentor andersoni]